MNKIFATLVMLGIAAMTIPSVMTHADTNDKLTGEWNGQPDVYEVNSEDARSTFYPYTSEENAISDNKQDSYMLLNTSKGYNWNFKWVAKPSDRLDDFDKISSNDYDSSSWDTITVPSSWQMTKNEDGSFKYEAPRYTNFTYPWTDIEKPVAPDVPTIFNPIGTYRMQFNIPENWEEKRVFINLDGVESAFYIWINGKKVGYSEDSYTRTEFDITDYLTTGQNTIALEVFKWSDGSWLEDQDNVRLSGIFRDVYLIATGKTQIKDFEVVTDLDSEYTDADLSVYATLRDFTKKVTNAKVSAKLYDKNGQVVFNDVEQNISFDEKGIGNTILTKHVTKPELWTAEKPTLYTLVVTLLDNEGKVLESTVNKIGFRKVEIKDKGTNKAQIYVNGKSVLLKGVNRHEINADTGRVITEDVMISDIKKMKSNNINAVRTCHYPDMPRWYELCDEYGIYILDETDLETHGQNDGANTEPSANAIPGNNDDWRGACVSRANNVFQRDKNHACVIIWSLGNEAGDGNVFQSMAEIFKGDKSARPTHYLDGVDNVDISSLMYAGPEWLGNTYVKTLTKPFILTEYSWSGGNSTGNLKTYWDAIRKVENFQGGFIWDWNDKALTTNVPNETKIRDKYTRREATVVGIMNNDPAEGNILKGYAVFDVDKKHNIDNQFTIGARVKPDSTTSNSRLKNIVDKGDVISIRENEQGENLDIVIKTVEEQWISVACPLPADWRNGEWKDVVATYDGAVAKCYINGTLIKTQNVNKNIYNSNSNKVVIGSNKDGNRSYDGEISEAYLLSRAIDDSEITAKKSAKLQKCVLYVDFDKLDETYGKGTYYAYGGDWNDKLNDGNFLMSGIVLPDRSLKPAMSEVKKQYQNLVAKAVDLDNGTIELNNENLATNLKEYDFTWELVENNKVIQSGSPVIDIEPTQTKEITIPIEEYVQKAGNDYFLNIRFALKSDTLYARKGHVVASEQFALSNRSQGDTVAAGKTNATVKETTSKISISDNDYAIEISKENGQITKYTYKNKDLINKGPEPNFWRASTVPDKLSGFDQKMANWRYAGRDRSTSKVEMVKSDSTIRVTVQGQLANTGDSTYSMSYVIYPDGSVQVNNKVVPDNTQSVLPEVGNIMTLPSEFENVSWYGRGPEENYSDRNTGSDVGVYTSTVTNMFTNYTVPSESGNRTDVRWVAFYNDDGAGFIASTTGVMNINAQHYTPEQLTGLRHLYQTTPTDKVIVRLMDRQMGVGGDKCWFTEETAAYKQYRNPSDQTYEYTYTLKPITNYSPNTAMEKALTNYRENEIRDIKIDGESIGDFKTETTEYTYDYIKQSKNGIPQVTADADGDVEITQADSENGTAQIKYVDSYGVTTIYKVKFTSSDEKLYLSDTTWKSATAGWSSVQKDHSVEGSNYKLKLRFGNEARTFDKGLGTHADSSIVYNISGRGYKYFETYVGINYRSELVKGNCIVSVLVDGKVKYTKNVKYGNNAEYVNVDIEGAKKLELKVDQGEGGIENDHVDWADAKFLPNTEHVFKNALEITILSAQAVNENLYTADTYSAMDQKLTEAQVVYNNSQATQEAVDSINEELKDAISNLEKNVLEDYVFNNFEDNTNFAPGVSGTSTLATTQLEDGVLKLTTSDDAWPFSDRVARVANTTNTSVDLSAYRYLVFDFKTTNSDTNGEFRLYNSQGNQIFGTWSDDSKYAFKQNEWVTVVMDLSDNDLSDVRYFAGGTYNSGAKYIRNIKFVQSVD